MIRASLIYVVALCSAIVEVQVAHSDPVWDGVSVPVTIEVSEDVPVGPGYCAHMQPKTLCAAGTEFIIKRGQRFRMVEMLQEGQCLIEYRAVQYRLSSCPWMPGFRSGLADGFVIVQFQNRD